MGVIFWLWKFLFSFVFLASICSERNRLSLIKKLHQSECRLTEIRIFLIFSMLRMACIHLFYFVQLFQYLS